MSLSSRVSAFAQRVANELKDPGWEDLSGYLLPGYTGSLFGKVRLGMVTIRGLVTGDFTEQNYMTPFADALPTRYRALATVPNQMTGGGSVAGDGQIGATVAVVMMGATGNLQYKTAGGGYYFPLLDGGSSLTFFTEERDESLRTNRRGLQTDRGVSGGKVSTDHDLAGVDRYQRLLSDSGIRRTSGEPCRNQHAHRNGDGSRGHAHRGDARTRVAAPVRHRGIRVDDRQSGMAVPRKREWHGLDQSAGRNGSDYLDLCLAGCAQPLTPVSGGGGE